MLSVNPLFQAVSCSILRICRISVKIIRIAAAPAARSAMGPAYIMPSIPMKIGKRMINGSKKRICLVSDKKIPLTGFPMAVKKVEVTGWIPFKKVANR